MQQIYLYVSHNDLSEISSKDFEGLANLKRLNLSFNKLKKLSLVPVEKLLKLEYLDLLNNPLDPEKSLSEESFRRDKRLWPTYTFPLSPAHLQPMLPPLMLQRPKKGPFQRKFQRHIKEVLSLT